MFNVVLERVDYFKDIYYRSPRILFLLTIKIFKDDGNLLPNVTFPYRFMSEAQQGPESLWRHSVQSAIAIVSTFVKFRLIVKNHWDNGNIDQDSNTDNSSHMTEVP